MPRELEPYQLIERTIIKTYRKEIWNPFIRGVKNYSLVNDFDKIAVCVEGTAPSMLTAKLMSQLKRVSDTDFEVVFIGFKEAEKNAKLLNIPLETVENEEAFYERVKELGCNKVAVSDTLDNVVESVLYEIFYNDEIKALLPKENRGEREIIRVLYCVESYNIEKWVKKNELSFPEKNDFSEKEKIIKNILKRLKDANPDVQHNVLTSLHALNIDTMPGYIKDGKHHSFLEKYD